MGKKEPNKRRGPPGRYKYNKLNQAGNHQNHMLEINTQSPNLKNQTFM